MNRKPWMKEIEEKVIKNLEIEFGSKAQRNAKISGTPGIFDAIFLIRGRTIVVEVKFTSTQFVPASTIDALLYRVIIAQKTTQRPVELMIVIVHTLDNEQLEFSEKSWARRALGGPANVILRFIPKDALNNI